MAAFTAMSGFTAGTREELLEESEKLGIYEDHVEPADGEEGVELGEYMQTNLSVRVRHDEEEDMNVTFYGNESGEDLEMLYENTSVQDGGYANYTWDNLEFGTEYEWFVNITEFGDETVYNQTEIWTFTTEEILITVNEPGDGAEVDIYDDMSTNLSVTVEHTAGKLMNVTFYEIDGQAPDKLYLNDSVESGDYANYTWDELDYGTEYKWMVTVKEFGREEFYNETDLMTFTTKSIIIAREPEDGTEVDLGPDMQTNLSIKVEYPESPLNITFYGNETGDPLEEVGMNQSVVSGEYGNYTWYGLDYGTEYTWYVEINVKGEEQVLTTSDNWTFTTEEDIIPSFELNLTIIGQGNVSVEYPDFSNEYNKNETLSIEETTEVYLNATADEGYYFHQWEINGDTNQTTNITVEMDEDKSITAQFNEKETPWFEVTIDAPEDGAEFSEGDMVTVKYTVENTGDIEDTQDIVFSVDGVEEDIEENVIVGAGEDWSGTFTWEAKEDGDYNLLVESDDDDDMVSITVVPLEAYFEVTITEYDKEVEEGEYITVEFTIKNTGDGDGTQDIEFLVGGDSEETKEMTIEAGEEKRGKFFWEAEGGSHILSVASEDDEDKVAVNVAIETVEPETPGLPGFTSILLVLATIFAIVIYYKKKQR